MTVKIIKPYETIQVTGDTSDPEALLSLSLKTRLRNGSSAFFLIDWVALESGGGNVNRNQASHPENGVL